MERRNKSQEDQFIKALYYAFGCQDNGHTCDPYAFASWHALRNLGDGRALSRTVQNTFQEWQAMTDEERHSHHSECMRMAYIAPGCPVPSLPLRWSDDQSRLP